MLVPNPGKSRNNTDDDGDVGEDAGGDNGAVVDLAVPDDVDDLVDQPSEARQGAARMDSSDVLQGRGDG